MKNLHPCWLRNDSEFAVNLLFCETAGMKMKTDVLSAAFPSLLCN